jgi:hypothetical protein
MMTKIAKFIDRAEAGQLRLFDDFGVKCSICYILP